MKIYIAGRIAGLDPQVAYAAFDHAERLLEKGGHTPLNPMKMVRQTVDSGPCRCGHAGQFHRTNIVGMGRVTACPCWHDDCMGQRCNGFQYVERPYFDLLLDALTVFLNAPVVGRADAIFMLHNWHDSKGARVEHAIAEIYEIPIYYQASELPIGCDWPEAK